MIILSYDTKTYNFKKYDVCKYNFKDWAISVIQEINPSVMELETLHNIVSSEELYKIKTHFHKSCMRKKYESK